MIVWVRDCPTLDEDEDEGEVTMDVEKRFPHFLKDKVTSWNYTPDVPPTQDTNLLISHGNFSLLNLSANTNRVCTGLHAH
ncbi:hypothetical protein E4U32_008108 [Claviceps aff. humidiphila group G2b]|nr:hypothetical protein E4U32_008108 [Claviceps aff. humidiphila group G2b]